MNAKNIEKVEQEKEKVQTKENNLKGRDLYNSGAVKDKNVELLGFKDDGREDDDNEDRRPREGFRGGRGSRGRGGFRGGKRGGDRSDFGLNEQNFPTL